jgi:hypothetical protein
LEEKIKLIWDFRGVDCLHIAKHYQIHLNEFISSCKVEYIDSGNLIINESHHTVYLIVYKNDMKFFRDKLKPNRGEAII